MFSNKRFARYTLVFLFLGILFNFFYTGLQNDHLNILTPYLAKNYGWTNMQITNPVTAAGIIVIVFYLIVGASFVKFGVRIIMVPAMIILGLASMGIGISGNNYTLYAISLFLVRLLVVPLQMGCFMLAANWFIKYRGRILGIVTAGSPLFSIIGISTLTIMANSIGITLGYLFIGAVILIMAAMTWLFLKDTPEDAGLYPDGAETAPKSENIGEEKTITVGTLLRQAKAWQLIISYGILQFVIVAMMAFMAVRYNALTPPGNQGPPLFVRALPFLSIGAIAGIPMSFVLGWIDDKLGSIKASLVLNLLFLFAVIPLAIMPVGGNKALMLIWAFGVACMTGGVPTMHPCVTSYVYGRHLYQSANKWIMTIQAIPMAFAVAFMAAMNDAGHLTTAYYVLLVMLAVSFITLLTMFKIPDANSADRDYGKIYEEV